MFRWRSRSAFDALRDQCVPFQEPKPVQEEVATPKSGLGLCLFVEVYNDDWNLLFAQYLIHMSYSKMHIWSQGE